MFFKWIGPTGNINQFHFFIKKGWSEAWVFHSAKKIMEEGEWQLIILDNEKKELIKKYFYVSKNAILLVPDQY